MTPLRRLLDRAALVAGHDLRLGVLAERLASVHGDAPMVSEASGRTLTFPQQKAPRRIIPVDGLPRTGTQKVQKAKLLPLFR